jgi:hypothetical protein
MVFFKERRRHNRYGKIFESNDSSFIPITYSLKITSGKSTTKFFNKKIRQNRDGKIFKSALLSFIPIDSTDGVPDDNIEEPNTFGYRITPDKNIEEPEKWLVPSAEQMHSTIYSQSTFAAVKTLNAVTCHEDMIPGYILCGVALHPNELSHFIHISKCEKNPSGRVGCQIT